MVDFFTHIPSHILSCDRLASQWQYSFRETAYKIPRLPTATIFLGVLDSAGIHRWYLIFLRFRNSYRYGKILKLANDGSLFLRRRASLLSPKHYPMRLGDDKRDPLSDWVGILKGFACFFNASSLTRCETYNFICESIHRRYNNIQEAEICVGVASEPDEYILSASCFGFVEESEADNT